MFSIRCGVGVLMFIFFKKLLIKLKLKRVLNFFDKADQCFSVFQKISLIDASLLKTINEMSSFSEYEHIVCKFNEYVHRINEHNISVKTTIKKIDGIISSHPISHIVENILIYSRQELSNILNEISTIHTYSIPNSFEYKDEYEEYKQKLSQIIDDFDLVQSQKRLIELIQKEIDGLPDAYLDEERSEILLSKAKEYEHTYNCFKRKYYPSPILDGYVVDKHNNTFINRHINDAIFDNINGRSLDEEQRRAVLCDAKSNLTIAGAGSGKTLTICGKVKYLLESGFAKENEILLLSYSKTSADDLAEKVKHITKDVVVETFHALGLKILTEYYGKKKAVEEQLKSYIVRFFEEESLKNPKIANDVFRYISLYFYATPVYKKKYSNEGEMFKDLKSADFKTLKECFKNLSEDLFDRETINKEFVKSNEELIIANYLFTNGIKYEYEKPYEIDTSTPDKRQYTPDFYLPEYHLYIEHYGIDKSGRTPQYDTKAEENYISSINWKREIHRANSTKCIETFSYEFAEGDIFDNLRKKLEQNGVEFKPLSQEQIFNALHNVYVGRDFSSFFNLIATFISLYKAQIRDNSKFEEFKQELDDSLYDSRRVKLFLDICREVYDFYMQNLRESDKIDFDDMILQSTEILNSNDNFKYKYIIVDEFQDISQSRAKFLLKLIEHGGSKLFAVGDDWQAIYRFAGCDVNIFLEFEKKFSGARLNYITSTHRNSFELQEIVEPFITANPAQYKKHITSKKHQECPVRIVFHGGNKMMALTKALQDISKINERAKVLVLGRNRHDIDACICKEVQVINYKQITHEDFPLMDLSYSTVHGSKGLESDFVVLISGEDAANGFPNKMEDDAVLSFLLGRRNNYEYAEERRLFYVALTRTKSIVYILSDKNRPSVFVSEIQNKCTILYDESNKKDNDRFCPWCKSGQLIVRESENKRAFYGCSNFPYCKYTNNDLKAVYNNYRCPVCGDYLVLRKSKHGYFYGCHSYPRCRYTQQNVENYKRNRIGFY